MKFWHSRLVNRENAGRFFTDKQTKRVIFGLVFIMLTWMSAQLIGFELPLIFERFQPAMQRFVKLYFPPLFKESFKLIDAIWVTFLLAVASGTIGSFLAYFTALAMSRTTGKNKVLSILVRFVTTFIRNVPSSIWAIILLLAFWFGEFLAFLVMTLGSFGFTARIFADMIDETNPDSIEALESTGANFWQIVAQSIFPETLPITISWALYSIENNIRDATIVGILAGGGIGHLIGIYKNFRRFDELAAAVICIVVMVLLFDQVSMYIRKRIL